MRYVSVSPYWVFDEIARRRVIFVADKSDKQIEFVNDMSVDEAVTLIEDAKDHTDRYEFWYEEKDEVKEDG